MKHNSILSILLVFMIFALSAVTVSAETAVEEYEISYYPCKMTSNLFVSYNQLNRFFAQQDKEGNIEILYDVPSMGKKGDTVGAYLVFMLDGKAIALFNRGNKPYIVTGHKRLPKRANDHDQFSFAYADVLYPEIFVKGGEALTFEQIEKMLGAKVIPLTKENMQSVLVITKTITEVIEKPAPKPVIKTITAKN